MNEKEYEAAKKAYYAAGGKKSVGKTKWAKGSKPITTTTTRSKKCMSYDISSPPKIRSSNYDSVYNIPTAYNGVKMMMGKY